MAPDSPALLEPGKGARMNRWDLPQGTDGQPADAPYALLAAFHPPIRRGAPEGLLRSASSSDAAASPAKAEKGKQSLVQMRFAALAAIDAMDAELHTEC
ncbi:hypothetical protein ACJ73_03718 [Blastomyces percursus]|uniref:Uncharacterized protein n=1 Tax=Blastomyces percursus TaxID=1658174 RepID=A0A1J9RA98_9EURO|nr:hypothetical protein ACJ73_03718 [Blastomyces percursus]